MTGKRSADQLETIAIRPRREQAKRVKLAPEAERPPNSSGSSSASTGSVSEASALQSSPENSDETRRSSLSSSDPSDEDSDSSVSESSSGEEGDTDDEGEEEVTSVRKGTKPDMSQCGIMGDAQNLRSRLSSFLPQLAQANQTLTDSEGAQNMEDVEDGEQHIEMDLGLGVLEEQRRKTDGAADDSSDSEGSSDSEADDDMPISPEAGEEKPAAKEKEKDVMGKLMGQRKKGGKAGIEDLG